MHRIDELHLEHPFMGARMLRDQLARQGIRAGRRHIGTLMLRMGIEALAPQPGTSKAAPGHKIYPYLLRKLAITRLRQQRRDAVRHQLYPAPLAQEIRRQRQIRHVHAAGRHEVTGDDRDGR